MPSRRRRALKIVAGVAVAFAVVLIVASVLILRRAESWAEDWMAREYNSEVRLSAFHVSIDFPVVECEGENLELQFKGRRDLPPLIAVKRFTMRTPILDLFRSKRRIQSLQLEGLQINVPPREETGNSGAFRKFSGKFHAVRFDQIVSVNAVLKILTRKPGKNPLEFDIQQLRLNSTGASDALEFQAVLTNPKPPGEITSAGVFGPWNAETPSLTPVSGNYDFSKADLSVFPGIAGILSSTGTYQGVLEKIDVNGKTETPDFRVTRASHAVDLSTTFHAIVDGTDGDTELQPVEAHFGQTDVVARGSVEGKKGVSGKTVTLDVSIDRARIQDLLLLAMKESPTMDGPIRVNTKFIVVPGSQEIPDRLYLNGNFELGSVHFSNSAVQQRIDNLSKRSEGKPNEVVNPAEAISDDDVATAMKGNFRLQTGILSLAGLNFAVPGADVQLAGTYALEPEELDLHGELKMKAKLSQTTTGFKSFLLRFADPLFSKGSNGSVVPIKITGPVQHPHYGLDLHRKREASANTAGGKVYALKARQQESAVHGERLAGDVGAPVGGQQ